MQFIDTLAAYLRSTDAVQAFCGAQNFFERGVIFGIAASAVSTLAIWLLSVVLGAAVGALTGRERSYKPRRWHRDF
jgi:hypothetical protein